MITNNTSYKQCYTDKELELLKSTLINIFEKRHLNKDSFKKLSRLGFEVIEGKKHIKLKLNGHCYTCSKSQSDYRSSKNLVAYIIKDLKT